MQRSISNVPTISSFQFLNTNVTFDLIFLPNISSSAFKFEICFAPWGIKFVLETEFNSPQTDLM